MRLPRVSALVGVAGACGMGIGIVALLLNKERDKLVNQDAFMRRAHDYVQKEPVVSNMLGDSITLGKASFNDGWGSMTTNNVQLRVPVKGDKDQGSLYVYAHRNDSLGKYKLCKLEMTFDKLKGKKLILFETNEEGQVVVGKPQPSTNPIESKQMEGKKTS